MMVLTADVADVVFGGYHHRKAYRGGTCIWGYQPPQADLAAACDIRVLPTATGWAVEACPAAGRAEVALDTSAEASAVPSGSLAGQCPVSITATATACARRVASPQGVAELSVNTSAAGVSLPAAAAQGAAQLSVAVSGDGAAVPAQAAQGVAESTVTAEGTAHSSAAAPVAAEAFVGEPAAIGMAHSAQVMALAEMIGISVVATGTLYFYIRPVAEDGNVVLLQAQKAVKMPGRVSIDVDYEPPVYITADVLSVTQCMTIAQSGDTLEVE